MIKVSDKHSHFTSTTKGRKWNGWK